MNTTTATIPAHSSRHRADRIGVAASVLCAIHCALAPVLLIAMPAFGRVWAHPASHALVALLIVPLAAFSIYRGYRTHQKRWVMASAMIGIFLVLIGAVLPALSDGETPSQAEALSQPPAQSNPTEASSSSEETCESCASQAPPLATTLDTSPATTCTDNCCPSVQVSDTGKVSLHIPPAAIVTTLGGFFLIAAHIGNLYAYGHSCCSSGSKEAALKLKTDFA